MKAESFEYKGYTFKPIGNILGGFKVMAHYLTSEYFIEVNNYSHQEFYKIAKKHHASVDVFEVNGKLYIPCSGRFCGVCGNPQIKTIEEYDRWYQ